MKIKLCLLFLLGLYLTQVQSQITKIVFEYHESGHLRKPKIKDLIITIDNLDNKPFIEIQKSEMGLEDYESFSNRRIQKLRNTVAKLKQAKNREDSLAISWILADRFSDRYTRIEKKLTVENYKEISTAVEKIQRAQISKLFNEGGLDGSTCSILFGGQDTSIKYTIWSPSFKSRQRGTTNFLNACKLILKYAAIKPSKIF